MVAVRKIKHLVQLFVAGLFVLTLVQFVQWDNISYNTRFKRFGLRENQELLNDEELTALERDLDVDHVLEKIQNAVRTRLKHKEEEEYYKAQRETLRNLQEQHERSYNDSEDSNSTSFHSASNPPTIPVAKQPTPVTKPMRDKSRDVPNKKASREREHRRHAKRFKWKVYPWDSRMHGQLNVHVWQAWCGNTIHDLRRNWFFPSYPDLHLTVRRFYVQHYEDDYGQRIFGYLHPPLSGKYIFALSSDDTSELWLSKDDNPENVKLLSWVGNLTSLTGSHQTEIGEFAKYNTQLSRQIYLKKGQRYFIEALHKQGTRKDHILVGWKIPGLPGFRYITGDSISMYIDDDNAPSDVTEYAQYIPQTLPSHTHSHTWSVVLDREVHKFGLNVEPDIEYHNRKVEYKSFDSILPNCTYEPSYIVNFTLRRYEGVKLIHDSAIYPNDNTILTHMKPYDKCRTRRLTDSHGNRLNVENPKLTNSSLYYEGVIKVFGDRSAVTTSSDLSEAYPVESFHRGDRIDGRTSEKPLPSLEEQRRILSKINNETHDLPQVVENEALHSNNPRDSYYGNVNQINSQNPKYDPQIRGASSSLSDLRRSSTNDVIRRKERPNNVLPRRESKASSEIRNRDSNQQTKSRQRSNLHVVKPMAPRIVRKGENALRKDAHSLRKQNRTLRKDDLAVRKDDRSSRNDNKRSVTPNKRQSNVVLRDSLENSINQDLQRESINQDEFHRHGNKVVRKVDSRDNDRRANQIRPMKQDVNTVTLRKLMFYSKNSEARGQVQTQTASKSAAAAEEDRNVEAQIESAKRTHDSVPVVRFNPRRTTQQRPSTLPKFMYEDAALTRLNIAREYIRRMQRVVQAYQYSMSGKQIADQIYRRYRINMTVHGISPFMNYNPWIYRHNSTNCTSDGNILLNENVAKGVVSKYMKEVEKKMPNAYTLKRIINIQENHDILKGDRYLMELELLDRRKNESVRLSQYIYQKIGETRFCLPHNFQIKHHVTVHVIVPVKNQGRWVQYFIDDMSELYLKTGDPHLNVIIVDFSSDDIDVEKALKRSALVRYRVITLKGPFQRAFGIQAGTTVVKNPNDIIFMCDLHLELPNNLISIIRKHCIQGKMAFAPIVTRLHCGFTPTIPYGFWELQGYGLFAMYRSDFSRVGGMNYREFGTRWGGEDWELLDRVLLHKMEVERLRIPNFYHFYHSKKGMWGSPTIDTVSSEIPGYYRNKNQIIPPYMPRKVQLVSANNIPSYSKRQRNLRGKGRPARVIRPPSRVRRGYRPRSAKNPPRPVPKEIY